MLKSVRGQGGQGLLVEREQGFGGRQDDDLPFVERAPLGQDRPDQDAR